MDDESKLSFATAEDEMLDSPHVKPVSQEFESESETLVMRLKSLANSSKIEMRLSMPVR